jgi:gamma-glutamylcyclotransferase (GGCT)/AIG2-like uncharacterized protein YtfP
MLLAVNGTLMRGFELNQSLVELGGRFVSDACTAPIYRLWNVQDRYPAMLRDLQGGAEISLELWELPAGNLVSLLENEPAGLTVGRIELEDGRTVLGVLAEPYIVVNCQEITPYKGWREFQAL